MVWNFWLPEKVKGLGDDAVQFKTLSKEEQRAYKWILSFLIFLDSIQTVNLPNFSEYITAPEVNLILSVQAYQEAIHSQSYATILETVVDSQEREEIYYFFKTDKHLRERNEYIDTLATQAKMVATDRMINYIRRDELTHVTIFANIIKEVKEEFPEIYDEQVIYDMMRDAVEQEISWSKHILGKKIIGMSHENTENYTKWLSNKRLDMLGLNPLYPEVVINPYKHLDAIQDNNSEKGNFFESTVTNYAQSSAMNGSWDF